jgi:hypothetical protein
MNHREMMTDDDELKSAPLSLASVEEGQAGAQAQGPNDSMRQAHVPPEGMRANRLP